MSAAADVDKNLRSSEAIAAYADLGSGLGHDGILSCLHLLHVHADLAGDVDAVLRSASCKMSRVGARHHGFRRSATCIDAGPAEFVALDKCNLHSRIGQSFRKRGPRLS